MQLTPVDIVLHFSGMHWVLIVLGFFITFFSLLIFIEDTRKRSNQFFFLLSFMVFLWGVAYAVSDVTEGTRLAYQSLALLYGIGGVLAPISLLLAYTFAEGDDEQDISRITWSSGIPYILLAAMFFAPGFIVGYGDQGALVFGFGFFLYVCYTLSLLSIGLWYLIKKYRTSAGIFSLEVRGIIVLFALAGLFSSFFSMGLPLVTHNLDLFWVGYIGTIVFLIISGVSAIKYNFWSFKVIATEFFISFVGLILLVELFFATSFFDLLVRTLVAILILFSSFFLVGSVRREFDSRDKIARLLRELDRINARLKILDKKKSEFLSTASHHLRDPLTSIQGYASMLMEDSFGQVTPMTKDALGKIFESSKRLVSIIADFLDTSNIESGDMKYVVEDLDMRKLVEGLVADMQLGALRAGLKLTFTVASKKDTYITLGDLGKIRQVVSNLIDNAIKYTPKGTIKVRLAKSDDGKKILLMVTDTGIGMSEETLQKIFKKFSRAEGVSKVYTEGTGLGLYVAREIVKKHNGHIWAESEGEKKGSSFTLELSAKAL